MTRLLTLLLTAVLGTSSLYAAFQEGGRGQTLSPQETRQPSSQARGRKAPTSPAMKSREAAFTIISQKGGLYHVFNKDGRYQMNVNDRDAFAREVEEGREGEIMTVVAPNGLTGQCGWRSWRSLCCWCSSFCCGDPDFPEYLPNFTSYLEGQRVTYLLPSGGQITGVFQNGRVKLSASAKKLFRDSLSDRKGYLTISVGNDINVSGPVSSYTECPGNPGCGFPFMYLLWPLDF